MPNAEILAGDCLAILPTLTAESIDAIVTDPPYGLKFMGKAWDHGVPGVPYWEAAYRVAKPGSYLVAFGGTRTAHRLTSAIEDAGWQIQDTLCWLYGSGFPKHKSKLKPAHEPITLAWKKGAKSTPLGIDACRIEAGNRPLRVHGGESTDSVALMGGSTSAFARGETSLGRWPANVVLDEAAASSLDEQSGERGNHGGAGDYPSRSAFGGGVVSPAPNDSGGASRFYYVAKASRTERGAGNTHPTVKPVALMRWLVRLVTPPNGLVLDPFTGSGTTGVACVHEGRRFIGCELNDEYAVIARARIAHATASTIPDLFSEGAA